MNKLGIIETLSRTLTYYRVGFWKLWAVNIILVAIPIILLILASIIGEPGGYVFSLAALVSLIVAAVLTLGYPTLIAAEVEAQGRVESSILTLLGKSLKRFWALLWIGIVFIVTIYLILVIIAFAVSASILLPGLEGLGGGAILFAVLLGVLLLAAPVYLSVIWSVIFPLTALKEGKLHSVFGRSAELTKGSRWRILGVNVIALLIYYGLYWSALMSFSAGLQDLGFFGEPSDIHGEWILLGLFLSAALIVFNGFYQLLTPAIYFGLVGEDQAEEQSE